MSAARRGDREAFEELVRITHPEVYRMAYRLTGDHNDAADVTQDAFLRAFRALPRFRGDAAFSTWMYRITANCASAQLARRGRHRHTQLSAADGVADERADHDPEAQASAAAGWDRLTEAVAGLPPRLRAVVVLRDIYDLPHDAIAAELGISVTAAKVRLHRGRRRLREELYPAAGAAGHGGPPEESSARAL